MNFFFNLASGLPLGQEKSGNQEKSGEIKKKEKNQEKMGGFKKVRKRQEI